MDKIGDKLSPLATLMCIFQFQILGYMDKRAEKLLKKKINGFFGLRWVALIFLCLSLTAEALLRVGVTAVAVSIAASVLPIRKVVGVDPVSAFHE